MPVYCPYCAAGLAEPVGRLCASCHKDIGFIAPALINAAVKVSGEMTEAVLFHQYRQEGAIEGVKDLEPGDLIEIFRAGLQHWAVYVGDGYIVELVALVSSGIISAVSGGVAGEVRKEKLQDVVKQDKWQKNNITHLNYDSKLKPRPKQEIVKEALSRVGKDVKYDAAAWNCEHFATWCRYGTGLSLQVPRRQGPTSPEHIPLSEPKPGDLIEIDRTGNKHWAVYVGDGYVVHLTGPNCSGGSGGSLSSSGGSVRAKITKDKLSTVVNGNDYRVNNLHDHEWIPRPAEEIVNEALSHLNEDVDYSVWNCNCEHFATWCRYGQSTSRQAEEGAIVAGLGLLGAGAL